MYRVWISFLFLIMRSSGKRFLTEIERGEPFCFFEVFDIQQKYHLMVMGQDYKVFGNFKVTISQMETRKWERVYQKANEGSRTVETYKITSSASTYSFCVYNEDKTPFNAVIYFSSGLEMMEFQSLPDKSDSENLDRELSWLSQQSTQFEELSNKLSGSAALARELSQMMGTKLIYLAAAGMMGIVMINFIFYYQLKKTFKNRKII